MSLKLWALQKLARARAKPTLERKSRRKEPGEMKPTLEKQGRLTVIAEAGIERRHRRKVRVRCECGVEKTVIYRSFRKNNTQSCGCLRDERRAKATTTHGHTMGSTRVRGQEDEP